VVKHGVDGFWWSRRCEGSGALRHRNLVPRRPRPRNGKIARINAKKNFCANDVIPAYENYYKPFLAESEFRFPGIPKFRRSSSH